MAIKMHEKNVKRASPPAFLAATFHSACSSAPSKTRNSAARGKAIAGLYARPMMEAVAINSSSKASETFPLTEYGSSSGLSEYLSTIEVLSLARLT